ncbi:thioredoxin [Balneolaceae bacterium ANBcel3]|nr:thioredoxin [Balneolaceae bacterium ANBcel3]
MNETMNKNIKELSFQEVVDGDKPVLVDFYADWCGPCRMMAPILEDVKKRLGDEVHVIKVDTDRHPDLAIQYQVRGIPTLMLFEKGKVRWQQAGVMQADQLEGVVRQNLS